MPKQLTTEELNVLIDQNSLDELREMVEHDPELAVYFTFVSQSGANEVLLTTEDDCLLWATNPRTGERWCAKYR